MSQLFDAGLQVERTLLAWRRTCLAFAIASLVGIRFGFEVVGDVAVIVGALGIAVAVAAYGGAHTRYRQTVAALTSDGRANTGGSPLAGITAAAALIGMVSAAFVLIGGTR